MLTVKSLPQYSFLKHAGGPVRGGGWSQNPQMNCNPVPVIPNSDTGCNIKILISHVVPITSQTLNWPIGPYRANGPSMSRLTPEWLKQFTLYNYTSSSDATLKFRSIFYGFSVLLLFFWSITHISHYGYFRYFFFTAGHSSNKLSQAAIWSSQLEGIPHDNTTGFVSKAWSHP